MKHNEAQERTGHAAEPVTEQASGSVAEPAAAPAQHAGKGFSKLWVLPGVLCLALGSIGIFLPILPTVPFYLVALFCFAKGSQRLYSWFTHSKLYHKHLESFVKKKAMTMKTKCSIVGTVTVVMGLGFFFMSRVPVARVILVIVWVAHVIYFFGVVKTQKNENGEGSHD